MPESYPRLPHQIFDQNTVIKHTFITLFRPCFDPVSTLFRPCFDPVSTLFRPCFDPVSTHQNVIARPLRDDSSCYSVCRRAAAARRPIRPKKIREIEFDWMTQHCSPQSHPHSVPEGLLAPLLHCCVTQHQHGVMLLWFCACFSQQFSVDEKGTQQEA